MAETRPAEPVYLDCAATTPIDPRVRDLVLHHLTDEFGNAGSRTHAHGQRARAAVEQARQRIAAVVGASRSEVVFTSGATEANNIAILGLAPFAAETGRRHIVATRIEHHAVLEPVHLLERRGFEVTWIAPDASGRVDPGAVVGAVRPDTLLVTVMQVNNETGVIQPVDEIATGLGCNEAYLHCDAAQGFAREPLDHPRIDFITASGHKLHAPKGVGALIARRRGSERPPLEPLIYGGGQERGLRPGTLPVALIAGFGLAAELAVSERAARRRDCLAFRARLFAGLEALRPEPNGDQARCVPHIVNLSIPGVDAEDVMEAWSGLVAISNGAACASAAFTCSHVLAAMGLPEPCKEGAVRISWWHGSPDPDWDAMRAAIASAA